MTDYMDNKLRKDHPDLLFTLIYPVKMEGGYSPFTCIRNGLWCYLRISDGIIDLDDFEPLYYRTNNKDDEEEDLPEYNEHCRLPATAKDFVDSLNLKNVMRAGKYGGDAVKVAQSAPDFISSFR